MKLKILGFLAMLFSVWQLQAQTIQLTSPNGGESLVGGTTKAITWSYTNIDNIKIEYSLNNGLTWKVISESTPASALSYNWVVPCIGSTKAKVRVTSTLQFIQDESNGTFTIPEPTVDITYPNGGEAFGTGTGQYIEWQTTGVTTLKVQYTTNNGSTWTDIGDFPAANGYCNWVAPSTANTQTRIRAFNIESTVNRDSSASVFSIFSLPNHNPDKYKGGAQDGYNMSSNLPDTIRVISPNGGESLYPTTSTTIAWSYRHIDNIKLEYSTDNGANWKTIVSDIPASQLSYTWSIPNTPSTECLLKISSMTNGVFDVSNTKFTINAASVTLTYPLGGESFGTGTGQYIEWDFSSISTVKVEYSADNGTSWTSIGTAPAANKYMNWVTPNTIGTNYLIRISDNTLPAVKDSSKAVFAVFALPSADPNKFKGGINDGYNMNSNLRDSVVLTSPNGGEIWTSASSKTIKWNYNEVDNVSLEFSLDDGLTWSTIVANIPASQLSYNWTVPTTPSYTCRIRIKDTSRDISDQNDSAFVIPRSYVQITYPNGGERFGTGTGQYIEWEYSDLATIKLEYSSDNGTSWNVIGTAPAANKYANWVVPNTVSDKLLIRATDVDNALLYSDQSNSTFSSYGIPTADPNKFKGGEGDGYSMYAFKDVLVKLFRPNGGEIWGNGTTQQIKWQTLNSSDSLKLEYSTDNEVTWNTIVTNLPNSPALYNWTIASPVSAICKVRATGMKGEIVDKSDNFFTIANENAIVTKALANTTFCSGASSTVSYTLNSTFNAGNKFIVQLSDSVGSFAGAVRNIGEVTATTVQPISVLFPKIYSQSSQYRVRVIGTNPPGIGTNNGSNITINPLPFVNLGNDTALCPGVSKTLNASNTGSTYIWSTGATTPTISVSNPGTYSVKVTNACGASYDTINILQKQMPILNFGGDTAICLNASVKLNAKTLNPEDSYLWSTGANTPAIYVVTPGNYQVTVSNTCGSKTFNKNVTILPTKTLELGNNKALCKDQVIDLDAGNAGSKFKWNTGDSTQLLKVTKPGTYIVTVSDACGQVSDQVTIIDGSFTVNSGKDTSVCKGSSITIRATGGNQYTWSNGQIGASITISPKDIMKFLVSSKNVYNCISMDEITIALKDTIAPSFADELVQCIGNKLEIQNVSKEGVKGFWTPAFDNSKTQTYLFTPTSGVCITKFSKTIAPVNPNSITPKVDILSSKNSDSICASEKVTFTAIPFNGGDNPVYEWFKNGQSIAQANSATLILENLAENDTVYVKMKSNASCAIGEFALSNKRVMKSQGRKVPTFTAIAPICAGQSINDLPIVSNNGIKGSWNPALNNTKTTEYVFTPQLNQCVDVIKMTIVVNDKPAKPTTACYETANWNASKCTWEITGQKPTQSSGLACYQKATWVDSTCSWNVTGDKPAQPTLACYQKATWVDSTCSWNVTGDKPAQPSLACYQNATWVDSTCSWDVTGDKPAQPSLACYQKATWVDSTCSWNVTGDKSAQPTLACYQKATWIDSTCSWNVTGDKPAQPTLACYQKATWIDSTCSWNVTGDKPAQPALACYQKATWVDSICSWNVTGDKPAQPTLACYQNATWIDSICSWNVTGDKPAQPSLTCYQKATWIDSTCSWNVTGDKPAQPSLACYQNATWVDSVCSWNVTGDKPAQPALACYQKATWIDSICSWNVTGDKPTQPSLACYQKATWVDSTCSWNVTGDKPAQPALACYQNATWVDSICSWNVTGDKPAQPTLACYQKATWVDSVCSWNVTGDKPAQPTLACYQKAAWVDSICSWNVTGDKTAQPQVACYQKATWVDSICSWNVTGDKPAQPNLACYQKAMWVDSICSWNVTGDKPAQPNLACYQKATWVDSTCSWNVTGDKPVQPNLACYQKAAWVDSICSWNVTGDKTAQPQVACYQKATWVDSICSWNVTGDKPAQPALACYQNATWVDSICSWNVTSDKPAQPALACYQKATWVDSTCSWKVTGDKPAQPSLACYQKATWVDSVCSWKVTGDKPAQPSLACYQKATWVDSVCSWNVTSDKPTQPTLACYQKATFVDSTCSWNITGDKPEKPQLNATDTYVFDSIKCTWIKTDSNKVSLMDKNNFINTIKVYPNPTSNILSITLDNLNGLENFYYKIIDLNGKEIYKTKVQSIHTEISLSSIAAKGVYILNIADENGATLENTKIILE